MKYFLPLFIGFNFIRLSQSQETVWYLSAQDWPAFKDMEAKKLTIALGVSYESDTSIIIGNILQRNLFLTLESKGSLPSLFRPMMGNGLSICMWAALVPNIKVPNDNRAYYILQERVKMNTEMVYVQLSINVDGGIQFSMENSIRNLFATTQNYYVPRDGTFVYICTRYKKTQNFPFAEENIMEIWVNGKVRKVSKKSIQQHKENDEEMAITIGDSKRESLPWKFAIMTIAEKYSEQFCCSPFGCQSKPCLSGGTCVPTYISSLSFTCFCVGLYGGNLCQDKLSACQLEPCKRGGTCENLPEDKFKCHCPADAFGDLCENEKIIPDPTKMSDLHLLAQSESLYPGEQAKFLFILAQIGVDASFQKRLIFRPTSQEQPSSPIGFPVFANTTEGLREFPHVLEDLVNSEYGFFYSIFNENLTKAGSYKIDITGKTKKETVHQISVIVKVFETLTGFKLKTASTKTEVNVSFPIILVSTENIPTRSYTRWRGIGKTWEEWTNFKSLGPTDPYRKKISTTFGNNVRLPLTTVYFYERNVVLPTVGQETLMVELVNKTENKTMKRTIATVVNIVSMKYFDVVPKFQIAHENKLFEMISITPLDLGTQPEIEWTLSDGQKIVQNEPTVKNCKKCIQDALKPEEFKNLILPKDFYTYTVKYSFDMPGDYTAVVTVRNMAYVIFTVTVNIVVIQPMSEIRLLTKDTVVTAGKRTPFLAVIHRPGTEPSIIWDIGSEVSQPDAELIRYGKTVDDELMEVLNPVDLEAFREGCFYQIKWHIFDSDGKVTLTAIGQNMKIPQRSDKLEVEVVYTISGLKMFVSDTTIVLHNIVTVVFTIVDLTPNTTAFILTFGDTDRQTVTELKYSDTVKPIERFIGLMKADYDELTAKGFFYKLVERKITKLGLTKVRLEVYIEDIQKTVMTANIHAVEMICSPNVTVTNVAQNISESIAYHRKDVVRFGVETTIKCTHRQLKSREWSLFKITSPANSTSVQKTKVKLADSIITTSEILEIPGNTLLFGQYFLQLKVIITQAETTGESFGSGYFDIILSPLRAVIVGGESRALSVNETLVLDGSESINPNGGKIFYTWSCSSEPAIILKNTCRGFTHAFTEKDPIISFRPGMFLPETNYTFKLTVRGSFPEEKASSVKQIIAMGVSPSIQVTCLRNCKQEVNPKEILVLEATCFHYGSLEFTWNIFKINNEGTEENFPWVPCSENGKKGDTLYLKTGCLHLRKRYIAKVTGKQAEISSQSLATYAFTVGAPPGDGSCDFTPKVGESLLTKFEVICDGFKDEDGPLTYQIFYENGINVADTHVSSKLTESYVGILLHKRYDQGSKNMYVPIGNPKSNYTGQITIAISDYFGISTMINYTIQVFPPKSLTKRQLEKIVLSHDEGSIHDLLMFAGDVEGAVNLAKCIADILNSEALPHVTGEDRSMFRKELIEILQKIPQQGFGFASETLETINYILHTSLEEIDTESSGVAVEIMEKIALNLTTNIVKDNVQTQLIYDTAINAFSAAASLMSVSAGVEPFHTKIRSENITLTENEEKRCAVSSRLLKVVDDISDALLTTSTRGEEDLHLSSNSIGVWLRKSDTSHNMGEVIGHEDAVKLPPISALDMNDSSKLNLDIKMISSPFNPYACSEDGDLINTHTVSLAIDALSRKSRKELSIQRTNESLIEVFLKRRAQPESVHSNVTTEGFPDDFFIRFHTTEIKTPGVTIHIQIDRENTNYSFLLTWNYDCLPQKQQFMETPYILPSTNKNKSFLLTLDSDSNETLQAGEYALGILPYTTSIAPSLGRNDSELAFDDSQGPVTIFYNLTIFVSRCMYYDEKNQKWSDKGCKVGPKTDGTVVHCICSHLSLFSASFLVAPNTVDVTKTIELFRTAKDNFVVIGFMIGSWLIYFCLLGYAIKKDRDDAKMDAGTSATVQIQLHGSRLTSRVRTLISPNRPLFRTGGEDWFLLKTDGSLGQIRGITISHDNGGKYPNWYLSQIKLMDPEAGRSWLFLVDKWITFDPNKGRAILYIYAVPERDMKKFRVVFRQRALNELRERHTWFSVFQCSPRSHFTRAQRVTCAFSVLVAAMLSNIMFFGTNPSSDNNIDKGEYTIIGITIDVKSIVIGLESSLLAYPFGFVVVQLFSLIKPRVSDEDEVNQLIEEAHWEMRAESIGSVAPSFMSGISRDSLESLTSQQKRTLYHFEGSTETITEFNKSFWSERQFNISETSLDIENVPSCFNEDNADVEVSKSLFNHGDYLYPAPMRTRMDFSPREYEFNAKEIPKLESHHFVFYLPWWCIYISWFLTISLTLLFTYFIMLYGLTYGYKKSMEWFTSDIISFAESNVLLDPLQVLIVLIVSCYLVEFLRTRQTR